MNEFDAPMVAVEHPDAEYLATALGRAGRAFTDSGAPEVEPLSGGRTGAVVSRLTGFDGQSYVLKQIPRKRAFREALGHEGEGLAWLRDITRSLPAALANPTLDVALNTRLDEWWLLMADVSSGIQSRVEWREDHTRRLFEAIANCHAAWWGTGAQALQSVASLAATTGVLTETARYVGSGHASAPWAARVGEEFPVPAMLLPGFLEAAGPDNADFYLQLLAEWPRIVERLNAYPATLLHGDLRRANIAFVNNQVALFDWEFVARGPAAVDLTWHWFLHYWAYAPDDGHTEAERYWLRDAYLSRLQQTLAEPVDERAFLASWNLGWLRVFCQIGFVLADGLTGQRQARTELIQQAFEQARRIAHEQLA